jgi:hypothetical protein
MTARHHRTPSPQLAPTRSAKAPRGRALIATAATAAVAASALTVAHSFASDSSRSGETPGDAPAPRIAFLNSTFEEGTGGWFVGSGDDLSRVPGGHGGAYAARVTQQHSGRATSALNDRANTIASTVAGKTYTASAWVRTTRPDVTVDLRVQEWPQWRSGSSNKSLGEAQKWVWLRDTGWHQLTVSYRAVESGTSLDLNVLGWQMERGSSFDVDDVTLGDLAAAPAPRPSATPTKSTGKPSATPKPTATPTATATPTGPTGPVGSSAAARAFPGQGTGAVLGFWDAGGTDVRHTESKMGSKFGAAHRYRDFDATALWPSSDEVKLATEGRLVHFSWETMSYSGRYDSKLQPAPGTSARDAHSNQHRKLWTYKQITSGSMDRYIDTIAKRLKSSPGTYLIDFNHESDDTPDMGGSNTQRAAAGSRTEYAAAYRHLVGRFRAVGVTNVAWGLTLAGWTTGDKGKWAELRQMWPGRGYVDIIMWDPYNNHASNWRDFGETVSGTYNAINAGLFDAVDPTAKNLPVGLGEFGSVPDARRPGWLRSIPSELRKLPNLVYLNYYSSGSWGSLKGDNASIAALGAASRDSWFK